MFHSLRFLLKQRLLRNLISGMSRRYAAVFKHRYLVEKRMDLLLLLDQKNAVDKHLLCRGYWEVDQIEYLVQMASYYRKEDDKVVFLDIGSHAGLYAISIFKLVNPDVVIAFEPVPINLVQMRTNFLLNNCLDNIEIIQKAVSDKCGKEQFIQASDKNRGMSRFAGESSMPDETILSVDCITIDSIATWNDALIIVKVDVEGAEDKVINGMLKMIANNRIIMQVERNVAPFALLEDRLVKLGFRYDRVFGMDYMFIKERI